MPRLLAHSCAHITDRRAAPATRQLPAPSLPRCSRHPPAGCLLQACRCRCLAPVAAPAVYRNKPSRRPSARPPPPATLPPCILPPVSLSTPLPPDHGPPDPHRGGPLPVADQGRHPQDARHPTGPRRRWAQALCAAAADDLPQVPGRPQRRGESRCACCAAPRCAALHCAVHNDLLCAQRTEAPGPLWGGYRRPSSTPRPGIPPNQPTNRPASLPACPSACMPACLSSRASSSTSAPLFLLPPPQLLPMGPYWTTLTPPTPTPPPHHPQVRACAAANLGELSRMALRPDALVAELATAARAAPEPALRAAPLCALRGVLATAGGRLSEAALAGVGAALTDAMARAGVWRLDVGRDGVAAAGRAGCLLLDLCPWSWPPAAPRPPSPVWVPYAVPRCTACCTSLHLLLPH
jgi:hypothetical protein